VSFGSIERVFEKDGKPIGNRGEAGHPYDGENTTTDVNFDIVLKPRSVPWGFRKLTRYIHSRYTKPHNIPIYITECGFTPEGEAQMRLEERIHDTQRQDYYAGYLKEMLEAVRDDGIDVRGFMAWSLMESVQHYQGGG
jgi:beta-glucosidase